MDVLCYPQTNPLLSNGSVSAKTSEFSSNTNTVTACSSSTKGPKVNDTIFPEEWKFEHMGINVHELAKLTRNFGFHL